MLLFQRLELKQTKTEIDTPVIETGALTVNEK